MGLPSFRRPGTPRFHARPSDNRRGTARQRGLSFAWDRKSYNYRRRHPVCEECARRGRPAVVAELVDHIVPRDDGGPLLDDENLQSLCNECHNGWKREIEAAARETGDIWILLVWVKQPETRPEAFRIT